MYAAPSQAEALQRLDDFVSECRESTAPELHA
jgi:hypothetical protein